MLEKGKISAGEFQILIIAFSTGTSLLVPPAYVTAISKQDAWIASALTTLISLLLILMYNHLGALFPSMTYVEYNEKIFGKWMGKITSLLYLYYFFHLAAGSLREIGDFFTTEVLDGTPIQMIMIIFLLTSLIGVRLGLEVISRSLLIFFPWIMVLLFMLFLFLIPQIKLVNIEPIFGEGIKPIVRGSYIYLGESLIELPIFLMIAPYVTDKQKMKKAFYKGTLIGGFVLTVLIAFCILVLGPDLTARQTFPSYMLGKKISIGNFLERIEIIVAIIWMLTIYFKLTLCYYGISLGLAQILGLKNYQILLFPLAFLLITFAIFMHPNIVHLYSFLIKTWPTFSLTICFIFPLLLLVIGKIKVRRSASKSLVK
jgi:spore germination protein KB